MKTSPRSTRLAGIVAEKLPLLIPQYLSPSQVGIITITDVQISGDLGVIDAYVTSIGAKTDPIVKLQSIAPKLAHELGKRVQLRRVPVLRFKADDSAQLMQKLS